jgi:hypothetical protein
MRRVERGEKRNINEAIFYRSKEWEITKNCLEILRNIKEARGEGAVEHIQLFQPKDYRRIRPK